MNTFIETYQPFPNGPVMVRVLKPFVANDFEFGPIHMSGPLEAEYTFGTDGRRNVVASRLVNPTMDVEATLLHELRELWKDGTDYSGKHPKRRWLERSSMGNSNTPEVPGFDGVYAEWQYGGMEDRQEMRGKSRKAESRQIELDAMHTRARRAVESATAMAGWVNAYNDKWSEYADRTAERLIKYVGDLVVNLRVKTEWLEENMVQEDVERVQAMEAEITSIDDQMKTLRERKRQLTERIYAKDRSTLERHLQAQQDPVLQALFTTAIERVRDEKSVSVNVIV